MAGYRYHSNKSQTLHMACSTRATSQSSRPIGNWVPYTWHAPREPLASHLDQSGTGCLRHGMLHEDHKPVISTSRELDALQLGALHEAQKPITDRAPYDTMSSS